MYALQGSPFECAPLVATGAHIRAKEDMDERFDCVDCGANTLDNGEYYMVHDQLWKKARMEPDGGMLCIGCLEERLGRQLTQRDFTDCPLNHQNSTRYLSKKYVAKHPTCISLFTGAGGAALGIRQAGFEVRVMVEWEKAACDILRANWTQEGHRKWCDREIERLRSEKKPDEKLIATLEKWKAEGWGRKGRKGSWYQKREPAILQADITKTTTEEILKAADLRVGEATLLEGGFPCQGFSLANGNRDNNDYSKDERNFLYLECIRVIREALPLSVMLENVPGLVSMERGRVIRMICNDLANSGYDVWWDILNAADYGVPQHRRRVIMICKRNDVFVMPDPERGCNPQLHIGGAPGTIKHPSWFEKKYRQETQMSLFDKLAA